MDKMNDLTTFEIATCQKGMAEIDFKSFAVIMVGAQSPSEISIVVLNKYGELSYGIVSQPSSINGTCNNGDFLVYDGEHLYNLYNQYLVPLNPNFESLYVPKSMLKTLTDNSYSLFNEIIMASKASMEYERTLI